MEQSKTNQPFTAQNAEELVRVAETRNTQLEKVIILIEEASKKGKTRKLFKSIRLNSETIDELNRRKFKIKIDGLRQLIYWGEDDGYLEPLPPVSDWFKVYN